MLQEKRLQKDSPEHFFVVGTDKYFPTSFWWPLSVLLWNEVRDIVQETGIKTIPIEKKCKKAKWLSGEALQIAKEEKQKAKGKRKDINI